MRSIDEVGPMTPTQRKQIQRFLLGLRRRLEGKSPLKIEPNRSETSEVGQEDEQPLNEMLQVIASSRNRNHGDVLHRVDKALAKAEEESGDFGLCEECGEAIPFGRLRAMPYAELCTECQAEHDAPR